LAYPFSSCIRRISFRCSFYCVFRVVYCLPRRFRTRWEVSVASGRFSLSSKYVWLLELYASTKSGRASTHLFCLVGDHITVQFGFQRSVEPFHDGSGVVMVLRVYRSVFDAVSGHPVSQLVGNELRSLVRHNVVQSESSLFRYLSQLAEALPRCL